MIRKVSFTEKYAIYMRPMIYLIADYLAFIMAEKSAILLRNLIMGGMMRLELAWIHFLVVYPGLMLLCMQVKRLYSRKAQFWQIVEKIWHAVLYASVAIVLELYFSQNANSVSRLFVVLLAIFAFVLIVIERYVLRKIFYKTGAFQVPIIIIGAGKTASLMVKGFKDSNIGYSVVGFLDDNGLGEGLENYKWMGKLDKAEEVIVKSGVKHVFVAAPGLEREVFARLICRVQPLVNKLTIVPAIIGIPMAELSVETLFNEKLMFLNAKNNLASAVNRILKRAFDLVSTIFGLIVISPILMYIAYRIKHDSPGPIIYDGKRIGQYGKLFKCYKFRSMYTNGDEILKEYFKKHPEKIEEWEKYHKLDDDPRITPIGNFIRRTSIDELPQLINVLKGDMSLVGPRPYIPEEKKDMQDAYDTIILAKPGITGYWQVSGRNNVTFAERLNLESWYVYNWSFWMDMELLVRTVFVVLNRTGAK